MKGLQRIEELLLQPSRHATTHLFLRPARLSPVRRGKRADGGENLLGQRHVSRRGGGKVLIAACYLSPEGVVLGADSASTYDTTSGPHHFNYGQKLFEISNEPETGTLGIVTWGMGGLEVGSYRTLIARLSDDLRANPPSNVEDACNRWIDLFWAAYTNSLAGDIARCQTLAAKDAYDPTAPNDQAKRTVQETELITLRDGRFVGFCLGGYTKQSRTPAAFEMLFDPLQGKPTPQSLPWAQSLWGVPAMIMRLIKGCGDEVRDAILATNKWNGTPAELDAVIAAHRLNHPRQFRSVKRLTSRTRAYLRP